MIERYVVEGYWEAGYAANEDPWSANVEPVDIWNSVTEPSTTWTDAVSEFNPWVDQDV